MYWRKGANETGKPKALGFGTKAFLVQWPPDAQQEVVGCSQALWLLGTQLVQC